MAILAGCDAGPGAPAADPWGGPDALAFPGAHVLLISVDTLRADRLGTYGYGRGTSPRLDALAAESIVFEEAYSHSPKTASSHMSLFTSLLPSVHKVCNVSARLELELTTLAENRTTLPQVLNRAGYFTAAVTSGGNLRPDMGFQRGFRNRFEGSMDDLSRHVARTVERWEEVARQDAPGFVFLHTYQVHGPYLPPPAFMERFAPVLRGVVAPRVEALKDLPFQAQWNAMNRPQGEQPAFWDGVEDFGAEEAATLSDLYDGEVGYTDEQLGLLLDRLEALGLLDSMIVVVLSDHGEEFGEHGHFEHDQLFREHLHVPLILRLPGGRRGGTRVTGQAGLIDVMPTLLELLALPGPEGMTGSSLVPAMTTGRTDDRAVIAERVMFLPAQYGATLRTGEQAVTLTCDARNGSSRLTAYDLRTDPGEHADVFGSAPWAAPIAALLRNALEAALALRAELDAEDAGGTVTLTDEAAVEDLARLGYTGEAPTDRRAAAEGTPLECWPEGP